MRKTSWFVGGLGSLAVLTQAMPARSVPETSHPAINRSSLSSSDSLDNDRGCSTVQQPDPLDANCPTADEESMAQVRSIAELSDVRPTDWAYQALQALIERYGVLTGYSDGTFRGNRTLTRYEFAAAVAQVLDIVEQQFGSQETNQIQEDLATLRRLQESYAVIASDLRDRLDRLDATTAQLAKNQFSTTTKLSGQTVLALTGGTNANATVLSRTRLDLQTGFAPNSLLLTQLEVGNNGADAVSKAHDRRQNLLGTTGLLADGGGSDYVAFSDRVQLRKLYYTFQPLAGLSLTVGARLPPRDFIDYNRFANDSARNFSSSFFANNPLIVQNQIDRFSGAGAAIAWKPKNAPVTLRALYVAADADRSNSELTKGGLFGDRNQGSVELEFTPVKNAAVRLQFTKATVNGVDISAAGINAEIAINQFFAVFGRYGQGHYDGFNPLLNQDLDWNPRTWAIGLFARRLLIPGSTAGVAIGQPFVEKDLGNATQTNIEAFYSFLLNDNISLTPALLVVKNPNNDRNGTIWQWLVRVVYSF